MACLAAEFERRRVRPSAGEDETAVARSSCALHAERFELFLQPIRSLHEMMGMAHYEVLLRLRTPDGDLLEPEVPGRRRDATDAQHRSLGGAHPAGMAGQQPQALGAGAGGVLHQPRRRSR